MLDKISWLHISDFHFRAGGDNFSQKVSCDALMRDIPSRLSDEFPLQFIVVTGDIAFSGKSSEYEIASTFLLLSWTNSIWMLGAFVSFPAITMLTAALVRICMKGFGRAWAVNGMSMNSWAWNPIGHC